MAMMTVGAASLRAMGKLGLKRRGEPAALRHAEMPIRRGSAEAGTFEHAFFAVSAPGETDAILRAARRTLDAGRRIRRDARMAGRALTVAERTLGSLTGSAVRVLEELLTLSRLHRGRVFPTYDYLAHATGLGRATIARALQVLDRIGFLVRQRRFKRISGEGAGPRIAQASNVYRLLLPALVLPHLPRWMRPAPVPIDEQQRATERLVEEQTMLARLNCRELARTRLSDGPLGSVLSQLGAAIDRAQREYHDEAQSLQDSLETTDTMDCRNSQKPQPAPLSADRSPDREIAGW